MYWNILVLMYLAPPCHSLFKETPLLLSLPRPPSPKARGRLRVRLVLRGLRLQAFGIGPSGRDLRLGWRGGVELGRCRMRRV